MLSLSNAMCEVDGGCAIHISFRKFDQLPKDSKNDDKNRQGKKATKSASHQHIQHRSSTTTPAPVVITTASTTCRHNTQHQLASSGTQHKKKQQQQQQQHGKARRRRRNREQNFNCYCR